MTSHRKLAEDFNQTRKFEDEKIDKTTSGRIIACLTRDQLVGQQVMRHAGHIETLLTITHPMFYESTFKPSGAPSGAPSATAAGQLRGSIKRTREEHKKEEEQQQVPVAVFSSLEKLEQITQDDKIDLTKKYLHEEQTIIDAVKTVTAPDFIPQETFLKSLRAACKGKWKPNPDKIDNIAANRKEAEKLEKNYKGIYILELLNVGLEVIKGGNAASEVYVYDMGHEIFKSKISYLYKHQKIFAK